MNIRTIAAVTGFLTAILAANYVTTEYGMVPVGFGLVATAGTYFAGLTFILRDSVQDLLGKRATVLLIVAGAGLSWFIADPYIALASGVAFLVSELADLAVYTPLKNTGRTWTARIASNTVGAIVDTFLFLAIAGFPIAGAWQGQIVGKLAVTGAFVGVALTLSMLSRKPVKAKDAYGNGAWMVLDLSRPPSPTGGPQHGPFATLAEAEAFAEGHSSYAVLPVVTV